MPLTDRLLLGPGPSNPYPEAVAALGRPMLGHLDPEFLAILDETMARLRTVFRTDERADVPDQRHRLGRHGGVLRQPGRAGRHRDRRRQRRVRRAHVRGRAPVRRRRRARRRGVGPRRSTRSACSTPSASTRDARLVAVVHAETSTGVENDIAPLAALRDTDTLLLVDTVTSLGGIPVEVDGWGVDASYSGTQKCLGVPPGLSPVTFSPRAVERIQTRALPPQSWYLDLSLIGDYVGGASRGVPPHRADLDGRARCTPGSARCSTRVSRRRGPGTGPSAPGSRTRCPASGSASSCPRATASPSSRPRGCPTAPTTPTLRKALLTEYGIEVGGGLGRVRRARPGASGSWATPPASGRSPPCSAPSASCWARRRRPSGGRRGEQHVLAVVAQLGDRLLHVGQRPVGLGLARPALVDGGVPAAAELLEARHVDAAVVQVAVELGELAVEEATVDADRVAAQRGRCRSATWPRT